jgi:hypothetical protein
VRDHEGIQLDIVKAEAVEVFEDHRCLTTGVEHEPAYLTGFRRKGGEVPCPVGFSTRGARSAYLRYVEHTEARKHRWVRCIGARSRKLVRYAG